MNVAQIPIPIPFPVQPAAPPPEPAAPDIAQRAESLTQELIAIFDKYMPPLASTVLARLILVIAIIVIGWLALRLASVLINRLGLRVLTARLGANSRARAQTLISLFFSVAKYVIIFFTFIMAVRQAGLDPTPFLGGAAIVGLAVSFGSQDLVKDIVTGTFVTVEDQFTVGEQVELGGKSGVVAAMSIRVVAIRDAQGSVHNIPYRSITLVTNASRSASGIAMDVFLAKPEDEPAAAVNAGEAMRMLADELSPVIRSCRVWGMINGGTPFAALRIEIECIANRTDFVQAEAAERIRKAFAAAGIAIAGDRIRFFNKTLFAADVADRAGSEAAERWVI